MKPNEKTQLYLIYPRAYKYAGSTFMRVFQLEEFINDHLNHLIDVQNVAVSNLRSNLLWNVWRLQFKSNSWIVLCKYAINRMPEEQLHALKKRNIKIAVDYIDRDMTGVPDCVDLHIASSHKQRDFLLSSGICSDKVVLLEHAADYRIFKYITPKKHNDKIFYLGEYQNAFIPMNLIKSIDIISYKDRLDLSILECISYYKLQYCVRPSYQNQSISVIKPLTKIMNSIALSIPPIISCDMEEALEILGPSYPFTISLTDPNDFKRVWELARNSQHAFDEALAAIQNASLSRSITTYADNIRDIFLQK